MNLSNIDSLESRILFIDNHLIVINKLPGELVQADKTGDQCLADLVKLYLKEKFNKPGDVYLGLLHRIDRPVSGIVAFARTSKAAARLSQAIQDRKWHKEYHAITLPWKAEALGVLEHWLRKDAAKNKSFAVSESDSNGKRAVLHFQLLRHLDRYSVMKIILETGRHHQIRCQLSLAGFPIKGDLKYGAKRSNPDSSISLHARRLVFEHPVQKITIDIQADYPEYWLDKEAK
jgi:23S rRNA pseudouridine1911/1915/1917 synthase